MSISKTNETTLNDRFKEMLDFGYRAGIVLTGWLPLSTRSILVRLISAPVLIPIRFFQSLGPEFSKKMTTYLVQDWTGGITDFYTKLGDDNPQLRDKIITKNLRYAAYMYSAFPNQPVQEFKTLPNHILIAADEGFPYDLDEKTQSTLIQIKNSLLKMGFKGKFLNFYHEKTKVCFNLAYDIEKKEAILCFMGLNAEDRFRPKNKNTFFQLMSMAAFDWLGGHPPASLQAIEIGRKIKEATSGTDITPVMVGHSHGGGIAQVAAAANGLKSVVFNSRPMGAGMRRYIGQSKIANNAKKMIAFSTKGDWLTDVRLLNLIAILFERIIGIVVPRNVGTGYQIPSSSSDRHEEFYNDMNNLTKNHPATTVSKWLNSLFGYKFENFQTLFLFDINQTSLEVEANCFSRKIVISSYMEVNTDQIDRLSELKQKFPHMHFEYFQTSKSNANSKPIFLAFSQSFDSDTIPNENEFKKILEKSAENTLKIEDFVKTFSKKCEKWHSRSENLSQLKSWNKHYGYPSIHKLRHGFGAIKI